MSGTTAGDDLKIPAFLARAPQELAKVTDTSDAPVETIDPKGLKLFQALSVCDQGRAVEDINQTWDTLLRELISLDLNEGLRKSKGQLTLKIGVDYEDGTARIKVETAVKTPRAPMRASVFWLTGDGRLTPENPRQMTMFRDVPNRRTTVVG